MAINDLQNKPIGPGGGTRRLHLNTDFCISAGAKQDRRGCKGWSFARYGSAVSGLSITATLVADNDNDASLRLAAA